MPSVGLVELDAHLFGTFSVAVNGERIEDQSWGRTAALRLVKLLLVTPGHDVGREIAGETLWPEMDAEHQAANVRKALHFARRAIERRGVVVLVADRQRIRVSPAVHLRLDLDDFVGAWERLERQSSDSSISGWDARLLLRLGARELLPDDQYEEWLAGLRERVALRWRALAIQAARERISEGRSREAESLLETVLFRDPADEEAHRLLIELLVSQRRHHAARQQFYLCRRELADAYGTEPAPETTALLAQLDGTPNRPGGVGRADSREPRFVGRRTELARIEAVIDEVAAGMGRCVVVRGPAGVGKTRLLEHASEELRDLGWRVISGRGIEAAGGLTYAPIASALAQLTSQDVEGLREPAASAAAFLAPRLGRRPSISFAHPAALASGVAAIVEELTASVPMALTIDDAQWLDEPTAVLVMELQRATSRRPFLLLLGVRTDEVVTAWVEEFLYALTIEGTSELELGPMRPRDVTGLVTAHLGGLHLDARLHEFLVERAAGNALFCLELARTLRDDGRIALSDRSWRTVGRLETSRVPTTVTRLVRSRTSRLDPHAVEILMLAAESGDSFRFARLASATSDSPEDVLEALDEGLRVGLLVEAGAGYRFRHPLFRAALRHQLPPGRRARLLYSAARTLAGSTDPTDPLAVAAAVKGGVDPAAVAERALAAAEAGLPEATSFAVAFGIAAGIRQASLFQGDIARLTLERSIALWRPMSDSQRAHFGASRGLRVLGDLLTAAGQDDAATAIYREAIEAAREPGELAEAWVAMAWVPYRHGDYWSSLTIFDEALALSDEPLVRVALLIESGWLHHRQNRQAEALALLREATEMSRGPGMELWRMRALDSVAGPLEKLGDGDAALASLQEALTIAIRLRDAVWEQRVRTHLVFRLTRAGAPSRARPHLDRAIELSRLSGDCYAQAVAMRAAAEMEFEIGDLAAAEARLSDEVTLLHEVGGNARHEAVAHARWAHVAHLRGNGAVRDMQAAVALDRAAQAGLADAEFAKRVASHVSQRAWVPSM